MTSPLAYGFRAGTFTGSRALEDVSYRRGVVHRRSRGNEGGGHRTAIAQKLVEIRKKYQATLREQLLAEMAKKEPDLTKMADAQAVLATLHNRDPEIRKQAIEQVVQIRKEVRQALSTSAPRRPGLNPQTAEHALRV